MSSPHSVVCYRSCMPSLVDEVTSGVTDVVTVLIVTNNVAAIGGARCWPRSTFGDIHDRDPGRAWCDIRASDASLPGSVGGCVARRSPGRSRGSAAPSRRFRAAVDPQDMGVRHLHPDRPGTTPQA